MFRPRAPAPYPDRRGHSSARPTRFSGRCLRGRPLPSKSSTSNAMDSARSRRQAGSDREGPLRPPAHFFVATPGFGSPRTSTDAECRTPRGVLIAGCNSAFGDRGFLQVPHPPYEKISLFPELARLGFWTLSPARRRKPRLRAHPQRIEKALGRQSDGRRLGSANWLAAPPG
jgi:hypothetical protein